MKVIVAFALFLFLVSAVTPAYLAVAQSGGVQVTASSVYILNRYGFAVVNETLTFTNNSTAGASIPTVHLGLGNLSSKVVDSAFVGNGFTETSAGPGGPFTVTGSSLGAGQNASFTISALVSGVVTTADNGTLQVLVLTSPDLDVAVQSLRQAVNMPASTSFVSSPVGVGGALDSSGGVYARTDSDVGAGAAKTAVLSVAASKSQDFNPLEVYSASRTVTVADSGLPVIVDSIRFRNMGTVSLSTIYVAPLSASNAPVTIIPQAEPRLFNPVTLAMNAYGISLSTYAGFSVSPGTNFTLTYEYTLGSGYYTVSGGQVTIHLPNAPPVPVVVDKYTMVVSVPAGVSVVQGAPQPAIDVSPRAGGNSTVAYALSAGWAVDSGVPAASIIFVLLLLGLFVSRTRVTEEEETEEETSSEVALAMIKAFDEKTDLINGMWPEVEGKDPNELSKQYFDELRGRLDTFRSRALQRLNEVRQKFTTQKFVELLNQIQATEREVDRAAKDKLNLYDQYYMRRMRKEVYDRLLPQYSKRLEKALNQLTDELHVVQRESKLL